MQSYIGIKESINDFNQLIKYLVRLKFYIRKMRLILSAFLIIMTPICHAQRCGGGIFSFDIINPGQEEITFTVYPFEVSHLQEFKSGYCYGGCALDRETAEKWRLILHTQRQNVKENSFFPLYEEHKVKKNRVEFITYELADEYRVVLFKCKDSGKEIFIAANLHGGCDHNRKINWSDEKPRLLQYGE